MVALLKSAKRPVRQPLKVVEKAVTASPGAQYMHGPQGLLNQPGVNPLLMQAFQRPMGISSLLPIYPSLMIQPLFETFTGVQPGTGTQPADECSAPPKVGQAQIATLTSPFGKQIERTESLQLSNMGRLVNNAEPTNLMIVNELTEQSRFIPEPATSADMVNGELKSQLFRLGLEFERSLEPAIFNGGMTASISGQNPVGLSSLINTGKIDAINGQLVPTMDSTILNWGGALFSSTATINGQSLDIVHWISSLMKFMTYRANAQRLSVGWCWAMRYDLFYELTAIWPYVYYTNAAQLSGSQSTNYVDAGQMVEMRDSMRSEQYLFVNNVKMPVIVTDGIYESNSAFGVQSDIYLIPLVANGIPMCYLEYFDYSNAQITELNNYLPPNTFYSTNGGMYMWTFQRDGYCMWLQAMLQLRIILRAPWLAARITNVSYNSALHTFSGIPGTLYAQPMSGLYQGTWGNQIYSNAN